MEPPKSDAFDGMQNFPRDGKLKVGFESDDEEGTAMFVFAGPSDKVVTAALDIAKAGTAVQGKTIEQVLYAWIEKHRGVAIRLLTEEIMKELDERDRQ